MQCDWHVVTWCLSSPEILLTSSSPYQFESASSGQFTEVKWRQAWLEIGWVTAWEFTVVPDYFFSSDDNIFVGDVL